MTPIGEYGLCIRAAAAAAAAIIHAQHRSEEHTSELQSLRHVGCRLLLEKIDEELLKNLAAPTGPGFGEHAVVGNLRIQIKAQEPFFYQPGAHRLQHFSLTGRFSD